MIRRRLAIGALALLGLVAAAGLGFAVNEISGESIGLSRTPLSAGDDPLAPPRRAGSEARGDRRDAARPAQPPAGLDRSDDNRSEDSSRDRSGSDDAERDRDGSEDSGRNRGSGSGSEDSGRNRGSGSGSDD